jgi:hypothetical protein
MRRLPETAPSRQSWKKPRQARGKLDIREKRTKGSGHTGCGADQIAAARDLSFFARFLAASRGCLFGLVGLWHKLSGR